MKQPTSSERAEWVAWMATLAMRERGEYRHLRSIAWDMVKAGVRSDSPSIRS